MKSRVFGVRGIRVKNSNLNAGFDKRPKQLPDGTFYNSDVSTKYLDRNYMIDAGYNVLVKNTMKMSPDGELYSCTFEEVLNDILKKDENPYVQLLNDFVDVQNFGATITKPINFGVTGVVQYTQGVNVFEDSNICVQEILSPFGVGNNKKRKKKSEDEKQLATNIGTHIFVDDALYVQNFYVNPANLNNLVEVINQENFKGYKKESYEIFKQAVRMSATVLNTRSKAGCYDEFSIFIALKEKSMKIINDISKYIDIDNSEDIVVIDLSRMQFIEDIDDVESIEVYYNKTTSIVKHNFSKATVKGILEDI